MIPDILKFTASELSSAYRKKEISPVEVIKILLDWVGQNNPKLNAFTTIDESFALENAKQSEKRWLQKEELYTLDGVPITVKDNFDLKGWPSLMGSKLSENKNATNSSLLVNNLINSGVNVFGKTTMPEFFWKISNESPLTGITRNPWNLLFSPGGSSGGAASATASGMCFLAVGSDGAGSIRAPASFCGLVGLKPSNGIIPVDPPAKIGNVSCIGPISRSVTDAAMLFNILQCRTTKDPMSLLCNYEDFTEGLNSEVKGIKVAFTDEMHSPFKSDAEVISIVRSAIEKIPLIFKKTCLVEDSPIKSKEEASDAINLVKILRFSYFYSVINELSDNKKLQLDQDLLYTAKLGEFYSTTDYINASHSMQLLNIKFYDFFDRYDILAMPTVHEPPFLVNSPAYPPNAISLPYNMMFFNFFHQPAISIPCGITKSGLPVGIQLISGRYRDKFLLQVAKALEDELNFSYFSFLN